MTKYYVLVVERDLEPKLYGPYASHKAQCLAARRQKRRRGDRDGIFWMDVNDVFPTSNPRPDPVDSISVGSFAGSFSS